MGLDLNIKHLQLQDREDLLQSILTPHWVCNWICLDSLSSVEQIVDKITYQIYALMFFTHNDESLTDDDFTILAKTYNQPIKAFIKDSVKQKITDILDRWEFINNHNESRFVFAIPSKYQKLFNELLTINTITPYGVKMHQLSACQNNLILAYVEHTSPYNLEQNINTVSLSKEVVDKYIEIIRAYVNKCFSNEETDILRYRERLKELIQHVKTLLLICTPVWSKLKHSSTKKMFETEIERKKRWIPLINDLLTPGTLPELLPHQIVCMNSNLIKHFYNYPKIENIYTDNNIFLTTQLIQELNLFSNDSNDYVY